MRSHTHARLGLGLGPCAKSCPRTTQRLRANLHRPDSALLLLYVRSNAMTFATIITDALCLNATDTYPTPIWHPSRCKHLPAMFFGPTDIGLAPPTSAGTEVFSSAVKKSCDGVRVKVILICSEEILPNGSLQSSCTNVEAINMSSLTCAHRPTSS